MLTTLERKEVELPDGKYSTATKSLASEASEILGYKPLEQEVFKSVGFSTGIRPIKAVFEQHGIEPFAPERVDAYKKKMERRANRRTKLLQLLTHQNLIIPAFFGCIGGGIAVLTLAIGFLCNWHDHKPLPTHYWWVVLPFVVLYPLVHYAFSTEGRQREVFSWKLEALKKYTKPVPEFAIARAVELKRALPDADFYVDELAGGTFITLDPFMVVSYAGNLYYIDVWDEPKFEGRRTK